jgi:hypothetical protein
MVVGAAADRVADLDLEGWAAEAGAVVLAA